MNRNQPQVSYAGLPQGWHNEIKAYIEDGARPCPFIESAFKNSLSNAAWAATDPIAKLTDLARIAQWLFYAAPALCHTSEAAVEAWIACGGVKGLEARKRLPPVNAEVIADRLIERQVVSL